MEHVYPSRNPHHINRSIGFAPMVLDQLINARPEPLPRFRRWWRLTKLNHEESDTHVLLNGLWELLEVPLRRALPEQRPTPRFTVSHVTPASLAPNKMTIIDGTSFMEMPFSSPTTTFRCTFKSSLRPAIAKNKLYSYEPLAKLRVHAEFFIARGN